MRVAGEENAMRIQALVATALLLTACSGQQTEDKVETEADMPFVTANGSPAGVYEVSGADGSVSIVTLYEDGTYSQVTPEGTDAAQGTLQVVDGKTCFRVHRPGAEALCYTESATDEDGTYTVTPDGGEPLTVRPMSAGSGAG
jgi:hypothetical protein